MKILLGLLLIGTFALFSCDEIEKATKPKAAKPVVEENKMISDIKQKVAEFKRSPARVEVRNYIKGADHKYQENVAMIKKMKIHLEPRADVYLEINLFTNEEDKNAPLVAQFMWFDIKTQNLILEENLNLE